MELIWWDVKVEGMAALKLIWNILKTSMLKLKFRLNWLDS